MPSALSVFFTVPPCSNLQQRWSNCALYPPRPDKLEVFLQKRHSQVNMPGLDVFDKPLLSLGGSVGSRVAEWDGTFAQSRGQWSVLNTGSAHYADSSGAPHQRPVLYFSLPTIATYSYGPSDYYFRVYWTPFILILLQVRLAIVYSSLAIIFSFLAISLLFQYLLWGQKQRRTIVFSNVVMVRKAHIFADVVVFVPPYCFHVTYMS